MMIWNQNSDKVFGKRKACPCQENYARFFHLEK
jgi:hypothetical protein